MKEIKELYQLYQQYPCITTDSRDCPKDSIFLALKGASFNGNEFAEAALRQGCAYAIVDEAPASLSRQGAALADRFILVDDCLQTYKDLAREHRRRFDIPVIGITGTNGKTTTKELIKAVLETEYNVLATAGNFNNDVGVPKTLFRLNEQHEIAVIEMGASHPGDIKTLVETVEPTCGLITSVGRAHLLGFGSFEGVVKTKGELYDFLRSHGGELFINSDNEYLMQMNHGFREVWYYGHSQRPDIMFKGEVVSCSPFLKFRWREQDTAKGFETEWMEVQTHLIGAYNLDNLLAAITVGAANGVTFQHINEALENYIPTNNRSQLTVTAHNRLIVDAYNANPTSMAAAIDNFRFIEDDHKMAILGMMGELGDVSTEEHQKVVNMLDKAGFEEVWLVGEEFMKTQCSFRKFHDVEEVKSEIVRQQPTGRCILIKGSNSVKLFQLPELL